MRGGSAGGTRSSIVSHTNGMSRELKYHQLLAANGSSTYASTIATLASGEKNGGDSRHLRQAKTGSKTAGTMLAAESHVKPAKKSYQRFSARADA